MVYTSVLKFSQNDISITVPQHRAGVVLRVSMSTIRIRTTVEISALI
jgi:hypothetical protein